MMKFLRSQSQTVLIVILAVIGLGFLFYGNSGSFLTSGGNTPTDFGRIDGEGLSMADLSNAVRSTRNALILQELQGRRQNITQAQLAQNAWRQLLLLHEAGKLHIDVSDSALIAYIQGLPEFQKNGVYSPDLYQNFASQLQTIAHISPDTYAALLHDQLRIDAVSRALFASFHAPASDIAGAYAKYFGPAQVSYVSFDAKSYAGTSQVTPDEIATAFKADPTNAAYRTAEQRQVDYVLFPLAPDQAKLSQKDKDAAIQALGEKALDFALALQPDPSATGATPPPADFRAEAKKRGLDVVTSNFFTAETPPQGLPPSPAFNNAAFALTKDDPISKVVQLENGVAVLHLDEIKPSELRPLAEVSPVIEADLQKKKAVQMEQMMAAIASASLRSAVEKGQDFKTAAAAQHLTVQTFPSFVPLKAPESDPRLQTIGYNVAEMSVGAVSEPVQIQSDNTVLILHLDSRAPADPAGFAAFEQRYRQSQDQQVRSWAFIDWTNWVSKQPGTHPPPNLNEYGAVE
jgi:peptidyl-prolyl cis-trans isomerase D